MRFTANVQSIIGVLGGAMLLYFNLYEPLFYLTIPGAVGIQPLPYCLFKIAILLVAINVLIAFAIPLFRKGYSAPKKSYYISMALCMLNILGYVLYVVFDAYPPMIFIMPPFLAPVAVVVACAMHLFIRPIELGQN